ncbi:MAG: DRTGG domain-containing protein [Treponemataceae bacterium]
MTVRSLAEALSCEIVQGEFEDSKVSGGYTSDLLSDVMAHAKTGDVLITIQSHKNTIAVAVLANLPAILICNSRPVPEDMIEAAKEEGIAILRTAETQFAVSGKLYALLKAGV